MMAAGGTRTTPARSAPRISTRSEVPVVSRGARDDGRVDRLAGRIDDARWRRRRHACKAADGHRRDDFETIGIDDAKDRVGGARLDEIPGIVPALRDDTGEARAHDRAAGKRVRSAARAPRL